MTSSDLIYLVRSTLVYFTFKLNFTNFIFVPNFGLRNHGRSSCSHCFQVDDVIRVSIVGNYTNRKMNLKKLEWSMEGVQGVVHELGVNVFNSPQWGTSPFLVRMNYNEVNILTGEWDVPHREFTSSQGMGMYLTGNAHSLYNYKMKLSWIAFWLCGYFE